MERLQHVLLFAALVCAILVVWNIEQWWQLLATALLLVIAAAGISSAREQNGKGKR